MHLCFPKVPPFALRSYSPLHHPDLPSLGRPRHPLCNDARPSSDCAQHPLPPSPALARSRARLSPQAVTGPRAHRAPPTSRPSRRSVATFRAARASPGQHLPRFLTALPPPVAASPAAGGRSADSRRPRSTRSPPVPHHMRIRADSHLQMKASHAARAGSYRFTQTRCLIATPRR